MNSPRAGMGVPQILRIILMLILLARHVFLEKLQYALESIGIVNHDLLNFIRVIIPDHPG